MHGFVIKYLTYMYQWLKTKRTKKMSFNTNLMSKKQIMSLGSKGNVQNRRTCGRAEVSVGSERARMQSSESGSNSPGRGERIALIPGLLWVRQSQLIPANLRRPEKHERVTSSRPIDLRRLM